MRTLAILVLTFAALFGFGRRDVRADDPGVVAENRFVRLGFDASKGGNLTGMTDKNSQRNLLAGDCRQRGLYQIDAVDVDGKSHRISGSAAKQSDVTWADGVVTIRHQIESPGAMTVTMTCRLPDNSPQTRWRIEIDNRSELNVREIAFPVIEAPESAEYVLLPYCDGCVVEKPGECYRVGHSQSCWYPGSASAQVLAAGLDHSGGLYYASHDAKGYKKRFTLRRDKQGLTLRAEHYPVDGPGNDYEQPYDVVLAPYSGTWRGAADLYKAWAVEQPWCARRVVERTDVPRWLKEAPMCLTVGLHRSAKEIGTEALYDRLHEHSRAYSTRLKRPVCVLLGGWQGKGYYISPHYFPPCGGNELFTRLTSRMEADGNKATVFLCGGVFWTLEKTPPIIDEPYDDWECFRREGEPYAVVGEDGKTLVSGVPDKRIGKHAYLCLAHPRTHEMMLEICRKIPELGVASTQLEMVGGGQPICYSKKHGHPPGGGHYQADATFRLLGAILKQGRRQRDDYALAIEEPGEFFIQVLSMYHARDNSDLIWPRSGIGVRGVPLFTYLYHEYAIGYLGQGSWPVTKEKGRSRRSELWHALNYVRGKTLGLSEWSNIVNPEEMEEHQLRMIDDISAVQHGPACNYLMTGRMLHPLPIDVPRVAIGVWDGRTKKTVELSHPAVLQGVYEYPPGSPGTATDKEAGHGIALINVAEEPVEFTLKLAPPRPDVAYTIRQHGRAGTKEIGALTGQARQHTFTLDGCEPAFVEIMPAR